MHKDIDQYNIFKNEPDNWKDLQIKVAQLLSDIGFDSEIEKDIETVRGKVNIDVFSVNNSEKPTTVILAECKNWNKNVPKSVVHSFRTVINDYGANFGFIISKVGFQKGAYEAIINSNIQLFSWFEFQEYFKEKWLEVMLKSVDRIAKPLWYFTAGISDFYMHELEKLSVNKKKRFYELIKKYDEFAFYGSKDFYLNHLSGEIEYLDQAIEERKDKMPVEVNCYSDYFYFIKEYCEEGLRLIDELFNQKIRRN